MTRSKYVARLGAKPGTEPDDRDSRDEVSAGMYDVSANARQLPKPKVDRSNRSGSARNHKGIIGARQGRPPLRSKCVASPAHDVPAKHLGHPDAQGRRKRTPEYQAWLAMRDRCANPKNADFADYGGRGIRVCERWASRPGGWLAFAEDMGPRPTGATLDRIDTNGDYSPENCRWVSWTAQARNRRSNRTVTMAGRTLSCAAWAEIGGMPRQTFVRRLNDGWQPALALIAPKGAGKGEFHEWAGIEPVK